MKPLAMNWSWLPNAITIARMLMAAPLAWLILHDAHTAALMVALVAGFSDALDGALAKRYGWSSRLGGVLDPVADKLLLVAAFVALGITGTLPMWLPILVVGRDVVIVGGAVAYHNLIGPLVAAPSTLSKVTTAMQIGLVLLFLVDGLDGVVMPRWLDDGAIWLVAALTLASGLHYVLVWSARSRRQWRAQRSGK
jgi:cardiolipin synthase